MLHFKRDQVWDALLGIAQVSSHSRLPTKIIFPDHHLSIPFMTWDWNNREMYFDDPEMKFQIAMYFSGEDEEILEHNRAMGNEAPDRSPPDDEKDNKILIGIIYLTIFLNDPDHSSREHVLFKFTAAGTTMSILFENSPSIQKGFMELLERNNGVSGVLDREEGGGRMFWFRGKSYNMDIHDAYMTPDEIEVMMMNRKQWDGNG
jgi:hypothetical protein